MNPPSGSAKNAGRGHIVHTISAAIRYARMRTGKMKRGRPSLGRISVRRVKSNLRIAAGEGELIHRKAALLLAVTEMDMISNTPKYKSKYEELMRFPLARLVELMRNLRRQ